jgi:hypothetical protein
MFADRKRLRVAGAFALLFVLYQLPEGIGIHLLGSFAVVGALMLLFHLAAWWVGRRLGSRTGFGAYALEAHPGFLRNLTLGVLLGGVAKGAALLAGMILGIYAVAVPESGPAALAGAALLGAMLTTLVPSLAEDIVTRGFWYRFGPRAWTGVRFVAASSIIFVLNHVYRYTEGPAEWARLFAMGLTLATALVVTRSLWAAFGIHWGWNLANALLDSTLAVRTLRPEVGWAVSSAAQLLALAAVLALWRVWAQGPGRAPLPTPVPAKPAGSARVPAGV